MKKFLKYFAFMALACAAFMTACMYLDSLNVDQPQPDGTMAPRIKVGETATFVVTGHVDVSGDRDDADILVFAMLAPRSWNIRYNVVPTYRATEALDWDDEQTMSVIPNTSSPKNMPGYTWPEALMERFGLGPNRFNDMEWVAWQADVPVWIYNGGHPQYEITIKCKVSDDNLTANLGFFVNDVADGMTGDDKYYKVAYSDPFTVYGGIGEEIDFSKLRFNTVEPSRALQDDLITFTFSGDAYENDLIEAEAIFFEGTAYTASGAQYTVNARNEETLMRRENTFTHTYTTTLWPMGFFNVPEDETITHIDYVFTNRDGSKVVNKSLDDKMGGGTPASDDIPFTFNLVCGY